MEYRKTVGILTEEAEDIANLLNYRPQSEEDYKEQCIPADTTVTIAAIGFANGYSIEMQLHGGTYENDCSTAWIDACLIDAEGNAVDVSDVSNTILDTFEAKYGDDVYSVRFVSHDLEKSREIADELIHVNVKEEIASASYYRDYFNVREFDMEM